MDISPRQVCPSTAGTADPTVTASGLTRSDYASPSDSLPQFCCRGGLSNPVTQGKLSPRLCLDHHPPTPRTKPIWLQGRPAGALAPEAKTHRPALRPTRHTLPTTSCSAKLPHATLLSPAPAKPLPTRPTGKRTAVRDGSSATALACSSHVPCRSFLQPYFTYFCSPVALSRKLSGGRGHRFVPQLHSTGLTGVRLRFLTQR